MAEFGMREVIKISAVLGSILAWVIIAMAHLFALVLALFALWWWQVSPDAVSTGVLSMLDSKPGKLLSAFGVTALLALGLWWWLLRWVHRNPIGTWLRKRLFDV